MAGRWLILGRSSLGGFLLACGFLPAALGLPAAPPAPPDIRDIVAPQPYSVGGDFWLWVVAGGCLLAAVAVGFLLFVALRKPKTVELPGARAVAEGRLAELRNRLEATDARAFGGEVADILRVFIGAQYGLHAERQTSPEFLESIQGWNYFSAVQHALLQEFLTRCDLLKFARLDATDDAKLRLVEQAAQFLATESPTLPAGTSAVTRPVVSASPLPAAPPPLPDALQAYAPPDARYMPPALRQTALPPAEPVAAAGPES